MTRRTVLALALVLAVACKKKDDAPSTGAYAGTDEGARALLAQLRAGNAAALTAALRPTSADYKAVFVDAAAAKAEAGYERLWSTSNAAITADPSATEIEIHHATTEELQSWAKPAEEHFPASYKKIAAQLRPGLTVYQWKFTAPTIPVPKVYEGLIFVNARWVWMPKPWRVLGEAPKK